MLHSSGEAITSDVIKAMKTAGLKNLSLLEPGETEFKASSDLEIQKVEPSALVEGDVLSDSLCGLDGTPIFPSGQVLDAPALVKARASGSRWATIRRRGMEAQQKQARDYLALKKPASASRGMKVDERVTERFRADLIQVRPILVPRGRIAVGVRDEFLRAVMVNTLAGAGHETMAWKASAADLGNLKSWRPDLLLLELDDCSGLCPAIRKTEEFGIMGVVVCAEDGRRAEIYRALEAGANDSVHRPPTPDLLLYKVRVGLQAMGRTTKLRPVILMERRGAPRVPVQTACTFRDPLLTKPLAVSSATLTDYGAGGARVEYDRPRGPNPHAVIPHGVHPKHFFYGYAKSNPLGRDLVVKFAPPGGAPLEKFAKVIHISVSMAQETLGLAFQKDRQTVRV
jgi:CheY-like chemotaxis protein